MKSRLVEETITNVTLECSYAQDTLTLEQIYSEYRSRIHRYLTRLIGEKDAEDLTQEVFIKVGQSLNSFNKQSSLSTWLFQISTNAATDRLRSRTYKQKASMVDVSETSLSQLCTEKAHSTEEQVIRKEMNECIQMYVSFLPENYRSILILSDMEGFKNSEIADILGLSLNTVKIRLHRAKAKLKKKLAANCNFYRTECNQLACEPKEPITKKIRPLHVNKS